MGVTVAVSTNERMTGDPCTGGRGFGCGTQAEIRRIDVIMAVVILRGDCFPQVVMTWDWSRGIAPDYTSALRLISERVNCFSADSSIVTPKPGLFGTSIVLFTFS